MIQNYSLKTIIFNVPSSFKIFQTYVAQEGGGGAGKLFQEGLKNQKYELFILLCWGVSYRLLWRRIFQIILITILAVILTWTLYASLLIFHSFHSLKFKIRDPVQLYLSVCCHMNIFVNHILWFMSLSNIWSFSLMI